MVLQLVNEKSYSNQCNIVEAHCYVELLRQNDEDSSSINIAEVIIVVRTHTQDVSTKKVFVSCESDTIQCHLMSNM